MISQSRQLLIEGYTPDDILTLPDEHIEAFVFTGEPLLVRVGSATLLGEYRRGADRIALELAHIDGGGEGVLPVVWRLAERYAQIHELQYVEWVVHAVNCANPNPKLRRVLLRRGFLVRDVPGFGEAYYYLHPVPHH